MPSNRVKLRSETEFTVLDKYVVLNCEGLSFTINYVLVFLRTLLLFSHNRKSAGYIKYVSGTSNITTVEQITDTHVDESFTYSNEFSKSTYISTRRFGLQPSMAKHIYLSDVLHFDDYKISKGCNG